jgi:hypothetical protein
MRFATLAQRLISVGLSGAVLVILPACAGHKELKAPCAAALNPSLFWSGSAFAGSDCGPMLEVNRQSSIDPHLVPDLPAAGYQEN